MKKIILILIFLILNVSCTTKVARPQLTGVIVDEQGVPIDSCTVGETVTDKNGKYVLPEVTYNKFFEILGGDPVFIFELVIKKGYEERRLSAQSGRGGVRVGSKWNMDTIRLRKINSDFSAIKLNGIWIAGITKNLDTVYITKKDQEYIEGKVDFISDKCDTYSRGYYFLGIDNLPKNVFERHIEFDLTTEILKARRVLIYGDSTMTKKIKYDTIYSQGKWKQERKTFYFHTNLPELNGTYKVVDFNYDSMQLVKK
ncbi:hypothetical protein HNQ02_003308 [Flavobacterium sp. 7E]|uniref:carboxypeptidase-like regulatory domain-containing protein n=1 Tax=Flavobacterium sp. 7E TaxID=2735898 RepID=UPI00156FD027|nr:carboxypeptidase-like regulatory domain-containing protein [Flavobacterium sp. 7E]NRS90368.1 hypothetical protein [Flavobacterium sp. 7E]